MKSCLRPDGTNTLWSAVEPRITSLNRRFVAGEVSYPDWCDELRRVRVALGLEV
jgi:hypothetical protein